MGWATEAVAANFAEFDHAEIARSLGCDGVHVSSADELRTAAQRAWPASPRRWSSTFLPRLSTSFKDVAQTLG